MPVIGIAEVQGGYELVQKVWGKRPPTGRRAPRKKVSILQFCHFGPFSGQPVSQSLTNVGNLFTASSTTYNLL